MVLVEDVMTESLGDYVREWFEPGFSHSFFSLQSVSVPDSTKPIPKLWVEDVEVQIEGDFGGDDFEVAGDVKVGGPTLEEGKAKLREALQRLGLSESSVNHPSLSTFDSNQLSQEKRRVKQELKRYDSDFQRRVGRVPAHAEKEPMRPLYVYYRRLKTLISHSESGARAGRRGSDDEGTPSQPGPRESLASLRGGRRSSGDPGRAGNLEDEIGVLEDRIDSLQSEKSTVRAKLQAFQQKFVDENHRAIKYHKDILPIEREYRLYKNLKEEITKAESQLRVLQGGHHN